MIQKNATFAIYENLEQAKKTVGLLLKLGFTKADIWIYQAKQDGSKDFAQVQRSQFKNGALIGALTGAAFAVGLFLFGTEFLASSIWIVKFVGVIVAGAALGAACGFLVGIGTPDPVAKRYGQYLEAGGILLSVHCGTPNQIVRAKEILSGSGGQDVHLADELKTWREANLERIEIETLPVEENNIISIIDLNHPDRRDIKRAKKDKELVSDENLF
jgi:hypothetical protein